MIGKGIFEELKKNGAADELPSDALIIARALQLQTEVVKENTEAMLQAIHLILRESGLSADKAVEVSAALAKGLSDAIINSKQRPVAYDIKVNRDGKGFIESLRATPLEKQ
jgi:hypothetical protein